MVRIRVAACLALALLVACSGSRGSGEAAVSDAGEARPDTVDTSAPRDDGKDVDPQILSDVVAGAFPMPGETQRRTIRVLWNSRSIANVACGGEAFGRPESTEDRFDQSRYADLELIAEKGLVEQGHDGAEPGELDMDDPRHDSGIVDVMDDCVATVMPSYFDWNQLGVPWADATHQAHQSRAVEATKPSTADCLRRDSGLQAQIDEIDPTASFLVEADSYLYGTLDDAQVDSEMARLSQVYAQCTSEYFAAMEAELRPERDRMVERNRELLERFARELSETGYVP